MTGYIIGLVLGVIIFLLQNFKPTSILFRISFLILTIVFLWGISYANLGYWNTLLIPIGVLVLCFICAFCFPYSSKSAINEYMIVNGRNYYAELHDDDRIGRINPPGLKQTYDRIMVGIVSKIVTTKSDFQRFGNLLYSKNFYPISEHTKGEIMEHINFVIDNVAKQSADWKNIRAKATSSIEKIFNAYVSVMSIHEEATRNLEEIEKQRMA